ncbi:ribonuclease BN, partial [Rhodococcus hoagii]|nr:ribonuclease BN [Prescottella equi]
SIQLPPRDTRDIEKREKQRSKDVEDGRRLRLSHSAASPTQGKESDDA